MSSKMISNRIEENITKITNLFLTLPSYIKKYIGIEELELWCCDSFVYTVIILYTKIEHH